jgi:cell division GTPase FtsZ
VKRRSFIRYLVGVAATCGTSLVGRLAHGSHPNEPSIASPVSTPGFLPSNSSASTERKALIKVVGVGGTGAGTGDRITREGLSGVEFVCVDMGDTPVGIDEVRQIMTLIRSRVAPGATIIVGGIHRDEMRNLLVAVARQKGFEKTYAIELALWIPRQSLSAL